MSTPPGWYPDPQDQSRQRYWDGQQWTSALQERPKTSAVWIWAAVAGIAVIAVIVWFVFDPAGTPESTATSRPSGSVWDEQPASSPPPESPTASPTPSPTPSQAQVVDCPTQPTVDPNDDMWSTGGLTMTVPDGWSEATASVSIFLTNQDTATLSMSGSGWMSFLEVGVARASAGFSDPATTAQQVIECHITSGYFPGYTGHEVLSVEPTEVSGTPGFQVEIHATSDQAPGGGALFLAVAILSTSGDLVVFWSGALDADEKAKTDQQSARESLTFG